MLNSNLYNVLRVEQLPATKISYGCSFNEVKDIQILILKKIEKHKSLLIKQMAKFQQAKF